MRNRDFNDTTRLFFEDFMKKSRKYQIKVDKNEFSVVLIDNKHDSQKTTKKILLDYTDKLKVGHIFTIENDKWLILQKEEIKNNVYSDFLVVKCNNYLKWVDKNGQVIETPCYITGKANSFVAQKYSSIKSTLIEDPQQQLSAIVPSIHKLADRTEIVLNGYGWKVSYVDDISVPGLAYISLEERRLLETDDMDQSLGNIDELNYVTIAPAFEEPFYLKLQVPTEIKFLTYKDKILQKNLDNIVITNLDEKDNSLIIKGSTITATKNKDYNLRATLENTNVTYDFTASIQATGELSYVILGNDSLKWGQRTGYQVLQAENGSYNLVAATIELEPTESAEIVEQTEFETTLLGKRTSGQAQEVTLNAYIDGVKVAAKVISIKSILG